MTGRCHGEAVGRSWAGATTTEASLAEWRGPRSNCLSSVRPWLLSDLCNLWEGNRPSLLSPLMARYALFYLTVQNWSPEH